MTWFLCYNRPSTLGPSITEKQWSRFERFDLVLVSAVADDEHCAGHEQPHRDVQRSRGRGAHRLRPADLYQHCIRAPAEGVEGGV